MINVINITPVIDLLRHISFNLLLPQTDLFNGYINFTLVLFVFLYAQLFLRIWYAKH